jgi:hypothetical protein
VTKSKGGISGGLEDDAVLRVGGASAGADERVRVAEEQGKRVYRRLEDILVFPEK